MRARIAVVVGAVVLLRMRTAWPLVLTVALAAIGVAAASDYRSEEPRSIAPRYAWVDRTLPAEARATLLWVGALENGCAGDEPRLELGKMAVYTQLLNSQIARVGHVGGDNGSRGLASETFAIRPDGVVTSKGVPLRPDFVVTQAQVAIVGSRVASLPASDVAMGNESEGSALTLWRVTPPLQLAIPQTCSSPETRASTIESLNPGASRIRPPRELAVSTLYWNRPVFRVEETGFNPHADGPSAASD